MSAPKAGWADVGARSRAIGNAVPFVGRPQTVMCRLAQVALVARYARDAVVRCLVRDGLVQWRYGRVTLLDLPRLRARAIGAMGTGA